MVKCVSMHLSIIIVTWNAKQYLQHCLSSINKFTRDLAYEIIVVDNGSEDGSIQMVKDSYPGVKLIENSKNLGFAAANNIGAAQAQGEILCFLNDDIELTENSLKIGFDEVTADNSIGVLGYHLKFPDGSHQDSVRRYPKLIDQIMVLTKLHNFFSKSKIVSYYLCKDFDYTRRQEVEQVMGACMFIPRIVFNKVGGFDERYFVWFEEVDLQKEIKKRLGLKTVYTPATEMIHVKGATFGKIVSVTNQRRLNSSMRKYFLKHHGFMQYIVIVAFQPLSMVLAGLIHIYKKLGGDIAKYKDEQQ